MARYLGWTIPFVSLNGTSCRIDIYDEDYHSSATTLQGADNPIEWNEDDDDDLLSVVRTKTGYIRVIEENYGDLNALYPKTDTEKYVKFYYGSTLYFTGYMQAQAFDAEWPVQPRVVSFPIQSPLAVAKGLHFDQPSSVGFVSIGNLLYQACNKLNADISDVIFPDAIYINSVAFDMTWRMSTLVCCPFNPDFSRAYGSTDDLYEPITIYDFIEGLCHCLGLMVHDSPKYLVFCRFDYLSTYYDWYVSTLADLSPYGQPSWRGGSPATDYSSAPILGNNNRESEIRPISKLELDYEGDFFEQEGAAFEHTVLYDPVGSNSNYATLEPVGVEIETDYPVYHSGRGVWVGAWGEQMRECFIVYPMTSWTQNTEILTIRFLVPPKNGGFRVILPIKQGTDLDEGGTCELGLVIKNGGYYYNGDENYHDWYTSYKVNVVSRLDSTVDLKLAVDKAVPVANQPLEVIIVHRTVTTGNFLIEDVKVDAGDTPSATYGQAADAKKKLILKDNNGSDKEAAISLLFNTAVKNKAMVLPASANGYRDGGVPADYSYMFQGQRKITVDTFIASNPTLYTRLVNFYEVSMNWRITSIGFKPWDDVMRISFTTLI